MTIMFRLRKDGPYRNYPVTEISIEGFRGVILIDTDEQYPATYIGRWFLRRTQEQSPLLATLYRLVYGSLP